MARFRRRQASLAMLMILVAAFGLAFAAIRAGRAIRMARLEREGAEARLAWSLRMEKLG